MPEVTAAQSYTWDQTRWAWDKGYGRLEDPNSTSSPSTMASSATSCAASPTAGCKVTVVPATATAADVLARKPDGMFLSNGPGDPAATGKYAVPAIKRLMDIGKPMFGICLGHQLLGLALGGKTRKMHQGHHGANHPVKDFTTGKVEITSMNHGFAVDSETLPADAEETHISLFDGSNCGLRSRASRCSRCSTTPRPRPAPGQPLPVHAASST